MTRPAVLVTDGELRAALAVVRSLGRAGYPVFVVATALRSIAGASRFVRGTDVVADPTAARDRFVDDVCQLVRRRGARFVIPIAEASLLALLSERDRLAGAVIPWPDIAAVRRICDKAGLLDAARELGIAVPTERRAATAAEAVAAADQLRFPLVLKPSRSVREQNGGRMATTGVRHAADRASLSARLAELGENAFPLLLQERITGPGIGMSLLLWDDRVIARFSHRRLREWPPSGGGSVYAESIAPDPALADRSAALLRHFGWRGVAMVEYKIDRATGTPYLMEVNGRFWGSLQLAIDSGVDFPALLVALAEGKTREAVLDYRVGLRWRWWWRDVDHLIERLRHPAATLAMPAEAPPRGAVARDFFVAFFRRRAGVPPGLADPMPFLAEAASWLGGRVARYRRRQTGASESGTVGA